MKTKGIKTPDNKKERVYSITELTRNIRIILEDSFPSVWVEGEVSNFTQHSSGHMYLTLKDASSQLSSVVFRGVNQKLKFKIKDGMQLVCFGRIGVYDKRGAYQLYIEKLEPKGVGALQLALEELKGKLKKEGLFDEAHKQPIPFLPTCIGVVTSPTGAAIKDILNVTKRRFSNVEIIISPVRVQGKGSELEIANAIRDFNTFNKDLSLGKKIDVMIIGRGGGSLEDLWSFNEEVVARAVYESEIPVISAVGHQIDYTIADFVADLRAPTPSAAAELVIPRKEELQEKISIMTGRLGKVLSNKIQLLREKLTKLKESYVLREPLNLFAQARQHLDELEKGLTVGLRHLLDSKKQGLMVSCGKLEALSPLAVLSRGYSITMKLPENEVLKDSKKLKKGDKVRTTLGSGSFVSNIEEVS